MENIDFFKLKKFIGIQFSEYGLCNDLIHKSWISTWASSVKKCKYPPNHGDAQKFARMGKSPTDDWTEHRIVLLCHAGS